MKRIQAALILSILLVLAARAEEHWTRVKSANFEVLTTGGEKKGREVILYFERVRAFFGGHGDAAGTGAARSHRRVRVRKTVHALRASRRSCRLHHELARPGICGA